MFRDRIFTGRRSVTFHTGAHLGPGETPRPPLDFDTEFNVDASAQYHAFEDAVSVMALYHQLEAVAGASFLP
nr:uncharacterized protein CTRU02_02898 [Colletotrichum truncatum]KAF6797856.1 hypothetical protein CTRU02_02898 [Colletotrichum truncatum]